MFPKLILVLLLCLSTQSWAQTSAEDDFKLARNLFRDAGDYATAARALPPSLFAIIPTIRS